jgi:hypothetical protein
LNQNKLILSKLRSISESQIEEADASIELLMKSDSKRNQVQKYFVKINETCKSNQSLFENYALIKKSIRTLTNVKKARDDLQKLLALKKEISDIENLLKVIFHFKNRIQGIIY